MSAQQRTNPTNRDGRARRHHEEMPVRESRTRGPRRCRITEPILITNGPPLPIHAVSYAFKVGTAIEIGRIRRELIYLVSLRATDGNTQAHAGKVFRDYARHLTEDCETLLALAASSGSTANITSTTETEKPTSLFDSIPDWFDLSTGRAWRLWGFRNMWDDQPREMTSLRAVRRFVRRYQEEIHTGLRPLPPYSEHEGRWVMHFVVEVSPEWPRTFAVTYEDEGEDAA